MSVKKEKILQKQVKNLRKEIARLERELAYFRKNAKPEAILNYDEKSMEIKSNDLDNPNISNKCPECGDNTKVLHLGPHDFLFCDNKECTWRRKLEKKSK
jgi:rRNA maturation protein Nop10